MTKIIDPYRIFFPIGLLVGFFGVLIWTPWLIKYSTFYPGSLHPDMMIGGFLLIYALGFLTTAIPSFTATPKMSSKERGMALILIAILSFSYMIHYSLLSHIADFSLLVYIIIFARKRFLSRAHEPPPSFIFIGIGLLFGAIGSLLFIGIDLNLISENIRPLAKSAFYTNFMLALVLGVGSRLIPALLGHRPAPTPMEPQINVMPRKSVWFLSTIPRDYKIASFVFILSFALETVDTTLVVAQLLKLILVTYIAVKYWKIFSLPKDKGYLQYMLWVSSWSVILSHVFLFAVPQWQLQSLHLLYISGFGLITLMISTRVTLSHGGQPLSIEKSSLMILSTGLIIILATLLRFVSPLILNQYEHLLLGASILWCFALVVWLKRFGMYWTKAS